MDAQFDTITVALIAFGALVAGYVVGRFASFGQSHVSTLSRPLTAGEREEIVALLVERQDIQAIRRIRELTGAGLKDAHQAVQLLKQDLGVGRLRA
jgi:ribosomal protein L7/L12